MPTNRIFAALIIALASGCTDTEPDKVLGSTTVHYGRFQLEIPTSRLENASILSVDGPVIRFADSSYLGGAAASRGTLEVPGDFALSMYPRYAFGLEPTDGLPADLKELLDGALRSFDIAPDAEVVETPNAKGSIYSACAYPSCLFFATEHAQDEHILMLYPEGLTRAEVLGFLGVPDAE